MRGSGRTSLPWVGMQVWIITSPALLLLLLSRCSGLSKAFFFPPIMGHRRWIRLSSSTAECLLTMRARERASFVAQCAVENWVDMLRGGTSTRDSESPCFDEARVYSSGHICRDSKTTRMGRG